MIILERFVGFLGAVLVGTGIWITASSWNNLWIDPGLVSLQRIIPLLGVLASVIGLGVISMTVSSFRREKK